MIEMAIWGKDAHGSALSNAITVRLCIDRIIAYIYRFSRRLSFAV
jgi:hypothetical protein